MTETYYGFVETTRDALLIFEACRLNLLPRVQRRFGERERQSIRSGSVFVWDEEESGMRRWTDGRTWSPSRVHGSFLIYYELEGRRHQFVAGNGGYPISSRNSSSVSAVPHCAFIPPASIYTPEITPKEHGLIKKSLSLTTRTNRKLHLICYYSPPDVAAARLPTPSSNPLFANLNPSSEIYPDSNGCSSSSSSSNNLSRVEGTPAYSSSGAFCNATTTSSNPHTPRPTHISVAATNSIAMPPTTPHIHTPVGTPVSASFISSQFPPHQPPRPIIIAHNPQQPLLPQTPTHNQAPQQLAYHPPPPHIMPAPTMAPSRAMPQAARRSLPCTGPELARLTCSRDGPAGTDGLYPPRSRQYSDMTSDFNSPRHSSISHNFHPRYHSNPASPRLRTSDSNGSYNAPPRAIASSGAPTPPSLVSSACNSPNAHAHACACPSCTASRNTTATKQQQSIVPQSFSASFVSMGSLPTPRTPNSWKLMPGTATPATAVVEDCGSASIKTRRQATNSLWTKDTKGLLISVPPPQVMSAVPSTAIPTLNHDAVKSQQQPTSPQVVAAASSEAVEYCTPEGKRRVRLPGIGSLPPIKDHHHDHVRQSALPSAPPHTALPSIKDPSTVLDKYRWSPYTTDKMARTPSNPLPSRRVSSRIRMLESPMTSEDRRQLAALKPDL